MQSKDACNAKLDLCDIRLLHFCRRRSPLSENIHFHLKNCIAAIENRSSTPENVETSSTFLRVRGPMDDAGIDMYPYESSRHQSGTVLDLGQVANCYDYVKLNGKWKIQINPKFKIL